MYFTRYHHLNLRWFLSSHINEHLQWSRSYFRNAFQSIRTPNLFFAISSRRTDGRLANFNRNVALFQPSPEFPSALSRNNGARFLFRFASSRKGFLYDILMQPLLCAKQWRTNAFVPDDRPPEAS